MATSKCGWVEGFYCRYEGELIQRHLQGSRLNRCMRLEEEVSKPREELRTKKPRDFNKNTVLFVVILVQYTICKVALVSEY